MALVCLTNQHIIIFNGSNELSFRRDIEPIYHLTARINLIIHNFIEELPRNRNGKVLGVNDNETSNLRDIRNTVAHNGLFWNTTNEDGRDYPNKCVI